MRIVRESTLLVLVAALGSLLAWWGVQFFGLEAIGSLLSYAGIIVSVLTLVSQRITAAEQALSELRDFDATTRDRFARDLRRFKASFRLRICVAIPCGVIAIVSGQLLDRGKDIPPYLATWMVLVGGATLLYGAVQTGALFWASSWPLQTASSLKRHLEREISKQARLADYREKRGKFEAI